MDDDDFDDIPDEDLMLALDHAQIPGVATTTASNHRVEAEQEDYFSDGSDGFEVTGHAAVNQTVSVAATTNPQRALGASQSFRQTTLFGQVRDEEPRQSQSFSRPFRVDLLQETPTHHALNPEALKTWVYPMNLGPIRDYQFSIVKIGLFNNTLVALPTGLGKTFIAAAIILNFYRWTRSAKIVFVAPTKPLVSQQVEACLNIAGIPRSETTLLTGETPAVLREGEWETKRLFFMTPQTLINDLSKGYADPKSIALLVVDEAHRATGDYAYVKVAEFLRRFSKSFRVIALTATPGSNVEAVQKVFDNLGISQVEVRSEDSIDIRKYVHARTEEVISLEPSDEMLRIQELFSLALKPFVNKLSGQNIYWGRDPMGLTVFGLLKTRNEWVNGPGRHINQGLKWSIVSVFTMLQRLAHSIKLLTFHGIHLFYQNLKDFRAEAEEKGGKGSKQESALLKDKNFQEMMAIMEKWTKTDGFVPHPKIPALSDTLLNHFMDAGPESNTRVIVFSEYRDSAEAIVKALNAHQPLIKAAVFVGQADSKRSTGMKQKQQIETIERFKSGGFNVLVATSIGEEGLDIGQVDMIVCYDSSSSPIRMLQRMGRTGRKRAGKIVVLVMKGKEEAKFGQSTDNYGWMQKAINEGTRFTLRHDLSSRIVPRDIRPEVETRIVDIPIENTQDTSLPEPKKTAAGLRKKPAKKKFNMPDGAETGFKSVAALLRQPRKAKAPSKTPSKAAKKEAPVEELVADVPHLDSVCLNQSQAAELARVYKSLPHQGINGKEIEEITLPDVTKYPQAQRTLRPAVHLKHGAHTKRCVRLFKLLGESQDPADRFVRPYVDYDPDGWKRLPVPPFARGGSPRNEEPQDPAGNGHVKHRASALTSKTRPSISGFLDVLMDDDEAEPQNAPAPATRGRGWRRGGTGSTRGGRQTAPKKKNKHSVSMFIDDMDEDADDDDHDEEEEPGSTPEPTTRGSGGRRDAAKSTRGRRKPQRGGSRLKGKGDHFEDIGGDCERTSDINDTDGSDSGADLEDFLVGDDQPISSMPSSLPSFQSTALTSRSPPSAQQSSVQRMPPTAAGFGEGSGQSLGALWDDTPFTQESDVDLPEIDKLLGGIGASKHGKRKTSPIDVTDDEPELEEDDVIRRPVAAKRRRVVDDSDDE